MEVLLASAKVLAAIRTGVISGLSCPSCTSRVQEELNCFMADNSEVCYVKPELDLELSACPIKCVSQEALAYFDYYQYSTIFNTAPYSYNKMPYRFWEFVKEYDYWLNHCRNIKLDSASTVNSDAKTNSNLSLLKNQFLKGAKK